jgi:gliding motility-associated-like protein
MVNHTDTLPSCNNNCDGSITILASNGVPNYVYTWSPAGSGSGPFAGGLCPGQYSCNVMDATGCAVTVNVNLVAPPPFTLTGNSTPTGCSSAIGTASVTVSGGNGPFTYLWATGDTTSSISNLQAGNYMVVVTDSAGCPDSIPVNVPSTGFNVAMTNTNLLCNGDCNATATANPSNGAAPYSYSWQPYGGNGQTATGLCSGFYIVTVTDTTGCVSTASVTISSPPPIIVAPSSNITICRGQSTVLTVSVSGGTQPYTYNWNNNLPNTSSHTISPTQTTIYSVQITDANGCQSPVQNTQVKVNPVPVPDFSSSPTDCPPSEVFFTNLTDSALTYLWNFGDPASGAANSSTLQTPSHIYNSGGNYTVTLIATNIYGCADTISIPAAVNVPPAPAVSLSASSQLLSILDPVTTFYNNTSGAISYFIDFGDGDTLSTTSTGPYVHTYDSLGTYQVMLIAWDAAGCSDTSWLTLIIEEPTSLYIPNAFTPNGDATNEIFMVGAVNVMDFELLIFDRWGMLIYASKDVNAGWNGTYDGNKCQEDVYVWRLKYTDIHDNRYERIGHVSLIR